MKSDRVKAPPMKPSKPKPTLEIVHGILDQAIKETGGRAVTYDSPQGEESMPKAVKVFNALFDKDLTVSEGWQFMSILKKVRSIQGEFKMDNHVDDCAYAAFAGKALQEEKRGEE